MRVVFLHYMVNDVLAFLRAVGIEGRASIPLTLAPVDADAASDGGGNVAKGVERYRSRS
jgi:hypothetical protein